jgi:hypothetical protein
MDDLQNQEKPEKKSGAEDKKAELAYKLLLQIRDLDNKLMWTRINTMLAIQGILFSFAATSFSSLMDKFPWIIILIAIFGLISAYFLRWEAMGGSFWVNYWQGKLSKIEREALGEFEIFRKLPHTITDPDARKKLKREGYKSTRKAIVIFSSMFIIVWMILIFYTIIIIAN